ncbi:hypothetical protein Tco_0167942, partial [Tanacetum coccineum]
FDAVVVNLDAGEKLGDVQRLQQDHDEDRWKRTNNLSKRYAGEAPDRQFTTPVRAFAISPLGLRGSISE